MPAQTAPDAPKPTDPAKAKPSRQRYVPTRTIERENKRVRAAQGNANARVIARVGDVKAGIQMLFDAAVTVATWIRARREAEVEWAPHALPLTTALKKVRRWAAPRPAARPWSGAVSRPTRGSPPSGCWAR